MILKSERTKYSNIIIKTDDFHISSSYVSILPYETYETLLSINRCIYNARIES